MLPTKQHTCPAVVSMSRTDYSGSLILLKRSGQQARQLTVRPSLNLEQ
jgi:hypothetical protein